MISGTMIVFFVALGGIVLLFALKRVEIGRGARFVEPLRVRADSGALTLKHWLAVAEWYLVQTPWFLGALLRYSIHVGAIAFARLARRSAAYAHWLADFVSYKHRHERRETKSQYLREVSDRANGAEKVDDRVARE